MGAPVLAAKNEKTGYNINKIKRDKSMKKQLAQSAW